MTAPSLQRVRALLVLRHVLHAGETTTRTGASRRRPHVACTEALTLLGGGPAFGVGADSLGILPAFTASRSTTACAWTTATPPARTSCAGARMIG
ncbi:hypothetical protein, partial [Streptomyces sp. 2A115]|uniref:hypothetical protein n=1 Tax=Streptomyces sp. 2A115 TaxID=3457439 RepID=UPI003FD5530E